MLTDEQRHALESAWAPARAAGVLGPATIDELDAHAAGFLPAVASFSDGSADRGLPRVRSAVDLGTGAGVPGLLLAVALPLSRWRLVDRDLRRCRLAERAVAALGLGDRVEVVHGRVDELAHDSSWRAAADLVVARLFGPAAEVVECGVPLLTDDGVLVVSVARTSIPAWRSADLGPLGAVVDAVDDRVAGTYVRVGRRGDLGPLFPRRPAARRRSPLLAF